MLEQPRIVVGRERNRIGLAAEEALNCFGGVTLTFVALGILLNGNGGMVYDATEVDRCRSARNRVVASTAAANSRSKRRFRRVHREIDAKTAADVPPYTKIRGPTQLKASLLYTVHVDVESFSKVLTRCNTRWYRSGSVNITCVRAWRILAS